MFKKHDMKYFSKYGRKMFAPEVHVHIRCSPIHFTMFHLYISSPNISSGDYDGIEEEKNQSDVANTGTNFPK